MRRVDDYGKVPARARPSVERAAAAARLAGAPAGEEAVADRMRQAARRARSSSVPSPALSGAAALAVAPAEGAPTPRREERPRPRHLRVVPDGALSPAQRRRRARAIVMAGVGAAAMIGLALVYFHVVLAQRQFAIDRLQTKVQQAQATYQERRLQVAQLGSPGHIISMAEGQLGMVQPSNVTYVTPAGGVTVAAGTATRPLGQTAPAAGDATVPAPAGDADWPRVKSQLAGMP